MISEDVNRFFNDCIIQVKNTREYLQQFVSLTNKDIQNLKVSQPEINIAEVTKSMAILAKPQQLQHMRGNKLTITNKYSEKFDNSLTSLWFCFYRFLFVKKLNTIVESIQTQILFDTFFKFMRYVNLDVIKDGQQITAFFNVVLYSVTAMHIGNYTKKPESISYDDLIQQLDKLDYSSNGGIDYFDGVEDPAFHQYISAKYVVDYLTDLIPDYEFIQDINNVAFRGQKELSEYSLNKLNEYCIENNTTKQELIKQAVYTHKEYIIAPLFDD